MLINGNEKVGLVHDFLCVASRMYRFSLDLPRAVKNRECVLEVECGDVLRS